MSLQNIKYQVLIHYSSKILYNCFFKLTSVIKIFEILCICISIVFIQLISQVCIILNVTSHFRITLSGHLIKPVTMFCYTYMKFNFFL